MSFWKKLSGKTKNETAEDYIVQNQNTDDGIKRIFLGGWSAYFNGDEKCINFLKAHAINKETAYNVSLAIELIFKDDKLIEANDLRKGVTQKRNLDSNQIGMKFMEITPNQIFEFERIDYSESYYGGECPDFFKMPEFEFVTFQYLGFLSKKDPAFNWLPFDLHLTTQIYLCYEPFFLDYSNPNSPTVIKPNYLNQSPVRGYADYINLNTEIVFEKTFFRTKKVNKYSVNTFGHTGVPAWTQSPEIPICPKANKPMKFLFQTCGLQKIKRANIENQDRYMYTDIGDIFVFFEPDSKVICYLIQTT